jgi:hypothetical protein
MRHVLPIFDRALPQGIISLSLCLLVGPDRPVQSARRRTPLRRARLRQAGARLLWSLQGTRRCVPRSINVFMDLVLVAAPDVFFYFFSSSFSFSFLLRRLRYRLTKTGGKRCEQEGCEKGAQGPSGKCIAHGGGRRCEEDGARHPTTRARQDSC